MEDNHIEFDTDRQSMSTGMPSSSSSSAYSPRQAMGQSEVPGMAAWLIKRGIIQNETQAKAILIGVVFVDFAIAALVIYFFVLR